MLAFSEEYGLAGLELLYVYGGIEQVSKYIVDNETWLFTVGDLTLQNQKRSQYKMNPGVLAWNHKYQYKFMVFNIYTERERQGLDVRA